jgi:hypothetical protein
MLLMDWALALFTWKEGIATLIPNNHLDTERKPPHRCTTNIYVSGRYGTSSHYTAAPHQNHIAEVLRPPCLRTAPIRAQLSCHQQ